MTRKRYLILICGVIFFILLATYALFGLVGEDFGNQDHNPPSNPTPYESNTVRYSPSNKLPQTEHLADKQQQMVYNAELNLQVDNVLEARKKMDEIEKKTDSYVVTSTDTEKNSYRYLTITYRVKQDQFQIFVNLVKNIASSAPHIQIQGQDVSEEVVDLEARLKAKQAMEKRLLDMMKQASTANDLLEIEKTLGSTQEEIEQIKGRLQFLQHRINYSTVSVEITQSVYQAVQDNQSLGSEMIQGFISSTSEAWIAIQYLLIFIARLIPFLLILTIIGYPIYLLINKKKHKK